MKESLQNLLKLQSLQFSVEKNPGVAGAMMEQRAKIPAPILVHYDRLVARGKKGLAAVRGQVCGGCHMLVPLGVVMTLRREEDIQLCENCGRYLYLPPAEPVVAAEPTAGPKPERKSRKLKKSLQAA
jgi:hypothetical protein